MSLVSTGDLVAAARAAGRGVFAFNLITLEHAEGVVQGAERAGAAVILQISQNTAAFRGIGAGALAVAAVAVARATSVPVALHLDHVSDVELLHRTAEWGCSSVMFDASTVEYAGNVEATRSARDWAHANGLWLEAELGEVGGKDGAHAPGVRTDPAEAASFVAATGVDALAVAVGSSHAMTTRSARLDLALIEALRARLPVPLVLHGSSGVAPGELAAAVSAGMTKINVGTLLNVALTNAVAAHLDAARSSDPRRYLAPARAAIADAVAGLITEVGVFAG